MRASLGYWKLTLAVSTGWLSAPAADLAPRADPMLPTDRICHAQLETESAGVFHGVGFVTEIQPETGALTLDHEAIVGLMPEMVMMYRVKTPELSRGLKVGERVGFDLDGESYTILSVKVIPP